MLNQKQDQIGLDRSEGGQCGLRPFTEGVGLQGPIESRGRPTGFQGVKDWAYRVLECRGGQQVGVTGSQEVIG